MRTARLAVQSDLVGQRQRLRFARRRDRAVYEAAELEIRMTGAEGVCAALHGLCFKRMLADSGLIGSLGRMDENRSKEERWHC